MKTKKTTTTLQWGRRSSRRKTPLPRCARHRLPSFNGAAAHRGGRPRAVPHGGDRRRGFNGAAAHRGGRRVDGPGPSGCAWSFNGAAAHRGGRLRATGAQKGPRSPLQWGRRSSRRKTREVRLRPLIETRASMGPPLIAAEDEVAHRLLALAGLASMGPPLIAAEDARDATFRMDVPIASMGPPLIAAEDLEGSLAATNYALSLQWGRRSSRRKTRAEGRRPVAGSPAGFNGAAAHRGGRPCDCARTALSHVPLQWGRRSSRRKTPGTGHVGTGAVWLQWGRRSSRRKTGSSSPTSPRPWRSFNGAAAHRGGRRAGRRSDSAATRALQWGRRSSRRKTHVVTLVMDRHLWRFNGAAAHRGGRPRARR